MATIATTGIVTDDSPLSVFDKQRLVWLNGRIEAVYFCAHKTDYHEPWLCNRPTAARLSFFRWQFVTRRISG